MTTYVTDPFADTPETAAPAPNQPPAYSDPGNFFESGAPSCRFTNLGDSHTGVILDFCETQQTDIITKEPKVWPDGNPRMMLIITLQTNERDDSIDDDDGERRLYVKKPSGLFGSIALAIKQSRGKFALGGTLSVRYVKNGTQRQAGLNAPKQYTARYAPPGTSIGSPLPTPSRYAPSGGGNGGGNGADQAEAVRKAMMGQAWKAFNAKHREAIESDPAIPETWKVSSITAIPETWKASVKRYFGLDTDPLTISAVGWRKFISDGFLPVDSPVEQEPHFSVDDIPF